MEEREMKVFPSKRDLVALIAAVGCSATAFAADSGFPDPVGDPAYVPQGSKLDRLFDGGCMLTEGVAAGHDGMIYFSDITFTKFCKDPSGKDSQAGKIWKKKTKTKEVSIFPSPSGLADGLQIERG